MISLHLSTEEAIFLAAQLERHLTTVEGELVHTDAHTMQQELAMDLDRLHAVAARLRHAIATARQEAGAPAL